MEPCEARLVAVGEIATPTRCDPGAGALRSKAGCEWGDQACLLLELKLAMAMELAMHYFLRSEVGACEARLTTVADLAIFRWTRSWSLRSKALQRSRRILQRTCQGVGGVLA